MQYRTHVQDPWDDWPPEFLREVGAHARTIWVWVPGLFSRLRPAFDPDSAQTLAWERVVPRVDRSGHPCAYAYLQFINDAHPLNPLRRGRFWNHSTRIGSRWAYTLGLSRRLGYMLWTLHGATGLPLRVCSEDFGARWVLGSGFPVAANLFDNPIISGEDLDRTPPGSPVFVRRSHLHFLSRWSDWMLDFPPELCIGAGNPVRGRHGLWRLCDRGAVVRYGGPVTVPSPSEAAAPAAAVPQEIIPLITHL